MKIGVIIQARMGSTRLPGKVLKRIKKRTVLDHVVTRVLKSSLIDKVIIATTTNKNDAPIIEEANKLGVITFRGSESDVLSRYYHAAKDNQLDAIVRITSDCPLIDPNVIDDIIEEFNRGGYDIVSNTGIDVSERTFPRGLDTEIFSFKSLKNAFNNAEKNYQREHVTPYIYENSKGQSIFKNPVDYSKHRWTLDTKEDFNLINKIYNKLYRPNEIFYLKDVIEIFNNNPQLFYINSDIEQKKLKADNERKS